MMLACEQPQGNLGLPKIELSTKELSFDEAGGEKSLYVKSTREWMVESISQDWVAVSPDKGDASADEQKVTVYVLENKGMDRSVDVVFTIGMFVALLIRLPPYLGLFSSVSKSELPPPVPFMTSKE